MKTDSYFAFGVNHQSAPVSVRERFELNEERIRHLYAAARLRKGTEWIVLSTCNRTEIYLFGRADAVIEVQTAFAELVGGWPTEAAFLHENEDAIRHLLEVTCGLRSQILGDAQILGQVKDAYRLAAGCQTVGSHLHRLMHTAFSAAKRVISSTALGSGGTSIAHTAVETLRREIAKKDSALETMRVLVLGGGSMGARILKELSGTRPGALMISNRTTPRAEQLAQHYAAQAIPWDERHECAAGADVVFSATAADGFVITLTDLKPFPHIGETLFIDISVPRNIDPLLSELPGFTLVNIDQLSMDENGTQAVRRNVEEARRICDELVQEAMGWETQTRAVAPAVRTLHETFESIRRREIERNIHRFQSSDHENVDRLTRSIMQKLIAIPIVRLKAMAENETDLAERLELLGSLFDKGNCEE